MHIKTIYLFSKAQLMNHSSICWVTACARQYADHQGHTQQQYSSYLGETVYDQKPKSQEAEECLYFCFQAPGYEHNMQLTHPKS